MSQLYELTCSKCNANLEMDIDNLMVFCPYCGNKIILDTEFLSRIELERERRKTSQDKYNHAEKMEDKRNRTEQNKIILKGISPALPTLIGMGLVFIIVIFAWVSIAMGGEVKLSTEDVKGMNYVQVAQKLSNEGFDNITYIPSDTAPEGKQYKDGDIIKLYIDGKELSDKSKKFDKDSTVIINFYTPDGLIEMPFSSEEIKGLNRSSVSNTLEYHGFSNIQLSGEKFLLYGVIYSNGDIIDMTVQNSEVFNAGDRFSMNTPIVIRYYYR